MQKRYDLAIIGGGPGGYTAALEAAKRKLSVALLEEAKLGGTCLNRGCIPTKAMLHAAALYRHAKNGADLGIIADGLHIDPMRLFAYRNETVDKLNRGLRQLLQSAGVDIIKGHGQLLPGRQVRVTGRGEEMIIEAENVILAAGSRPKSLPVEGINLPGVVTSDGLLALEHIPASLTIIGGGVIGVEFAEIYASLGCKVTIIEAAGQILPAVDKDIANNLKQIMKKRGVAIHTGAKLQRIEKKEALLSCIFTERDMLNEVKSEYVLIAVGRSANISDLCANNVELKTQDGCLAVNEHFMTDIPSVYAVGDLISGSQLAHAAMAQAAAVIAYISGEKSITDLTIVPSCVYTEPEIAFVGMSEDEAKVQGLNVKPVKYVMHSNAKSVIERQERELLKLVVDADSMRIIGAQMMCANASDMISEFTDAIVNGLTAEHLLKAMRPHPTHSEAIAEMLKQAY